MGMEGGWEREILRGNMIKKLIVLLIAVSFTKAAYCQVSVHRSKVVNCAQATRTRPQIGNVFRGSVSNDDYAFSARIPNGLTGWGGVYKDAPFHGFTIFLDSNMEACIVFEVHLGSKATIRQDHPQPLRQFNLERRKDGSGSGKVGLQILV